MDGADALELATHCSPNNNWNMAKSNMHGYKWQGVVGACMTRGE